MPKLFSRTDHPETDEMDLSSPPTVLIADDDPDDRMFLDDAFEEACPSLRRVFAADGADLLATLQKINPADTLLVLVDLNMPRMNGLEVLEAIRADPRLAHLRTIVLSTSSAESDVRASYDRGAATFFTKPHGYTELVELARHIGGYWSRALLPETEG